MSLSESLARRLQLPLIAAPMLRISGPELVIAACQSGVIGAFPTANARSIEELDAWLVRIRRELDNSGLPYAPWCPNLIIKRSAEILRQEVACLVKHGVEIVITSVGSPASVIAPLHDAGCLVFADVASVRHAEKAIAAGADGLILLTAGAGGQTGWANSFAFVRAVRRFFAGPLVLAGGVADGAALWAAQALGCDLGYMGTKFIATRESMASESYRQMLVDSELDDVVLTRAFTGLDTSMLRPSIIAAGLDPLALGEVLTPEQTRALFGPAADGPQRWQDIWSAGHSVSGVTAVTTVAQLIAVTRQEYGEAMQHSQSLARDWTLSTPSNQAYSEVSV